MEMIFISIFKALPDPRIERKKLYPLEKILLVALATILVDGDSYTDIEKFELSRRF